MLWLVSCCNYCICRWKWWKCHFRPSNYWNFPGFSPPVGDLSPECVGEFLAPPLYSIWHNKQHGSYFYLYRNIVFLSFLKYSSWINITYIQNKMYSNFQELTKYVRHNYGMKEIKLLSLQLVGHKIFLKKSFLLFLNIIQLVHCKNVLYQTVCML